MKSKVKQTNNRTLLSLAALVVGSVFVGWKWNSSLDEPGIHDVDAVQVASSHSDTSASDREMAALRARISALERQGAMPPSAEDSTSRSDPGETAGEETVDENTNVHESSLSPEALHATLEGTFADVTPSGSATRMRRNELTEAMSQNPEISAGTLIDDVVCSARECRVSVSHSDEESAGRFRGSINLMFPWAAAGHITDEGTASTIFVAADRDALNGIFGAAHP